MGSEGYLMPFLWTGALILILLGSAAAGLIVQYHVDKRHTSPSAIDSIRVLMGMLLTFSALVLGLLTSNAKQRFDGFNDELSGYATDLIEVDHRLRMYGPEAAPIRQDLRAYTAAAFADSWPDEPAPSGEYPRLPQKDSSAVESTELGAMLTLVDEEIEHLVPANAFQQQVAARLRDRMSQAVRARWVLIFSANSTISWPFLLVLTSWLAIIFAIFGMTSPPSGLVYAIVVMSAVSIASPVYLILDYSGALTGLIKLSSGSMRSALQHMDAPEATVVPATPGWSLMPTTGSPPPVSRRPDE